MSFIKWFSSVTQSLCESVTKPFPCLENGHSTSFSCPCCTPCALAAPAWLYQFYCNSVQCTGHSTQSTVHSEQHTIQCTVNTLQCIMHSAHSILPSVLHTVHSEQCSLCSTQCTLNCEQCKSHTLHSQEYTVYSEQCTVYTEQCTESLQCSLTKSVLSNRSCHQYKVVGP